MRSLFSASGVFVVVVLLFSLGYGQNRDDVEEAKLLSVPKVVVPKETSETGLGGKVNVFVAIDEDGNVTSIQSVNGPGPVCPSVKRADIAAIRNAAGTAATGAKFSPATKKGKPTKSTLWLNFDFPENPGKFKPTFSAAPVGGSTGNAEDNDAPRVIKGGVINGKALKLPRPDYPRAARAVRASGAVVIQVLIIEDGTVFSAEPVSGHPLLRMAARQAACEAKFSPTSLEGSLVRVSGVITYNFVP